MLTLSVRGLPRSTTEQSLTELFSRHGKVRSLKLARDLFSGECRGFATIEMEGHDARTAIAALNGFNVDGQMIKVDFDKPKPFGRGRR
jgi:RNA recognition motif-containing protein